jgi:hypothetical protein
MLGGPAAPSAAPAPLGLAEPADAQPADAHLAFGTSSSGTPISFGTVPPDTTKAGLFGGQLTRPTAAAPAAGKPNRPSSTPLFGPSASSPLPFGAPPSAVGAGSNLRNACLRARR